MVCVVYHVFSFFDTNVTRPLQEGVYAYIINITISIMDNMDSQQDYLYESNSPLSVNEFYVQYICKETLEQNHHY